MFDDLGCSWGNREGLDNLDCAWGAYKTSTAQLPRQQLWSLLAPQNDGPPLFNFFVAFCLGACGLGSLGPLGQFFNASPPEKVFGGLY